MATWLVAAALSTAFVGFVWLIVAACRGVRRGLTNAGPAVSTDGVSWMYLGDSSHSSGHHCHDSGGCDSGSDGGGSDGGGGGGD